MVRSSEGNRFCLEQLPANCTSAALSARLVSMEILTLLHIKLAQRRSGDLFRMSVCGKTQVSLAHALVPYTSEARQTKLTDISAGFLLA